MASNNSSELADFVTSGQVNSYLAITSCTLILFVVPGLILNGLVAVVLASEIAKKQGRAQWIILLNISLAGLATTLSVVTFSAPRLFLVDNVQEDAMWVCRVSFSAVHISIAIRTASLALLSVVVYIIIKHGLSKVKVLPLVAAVVILWVVVVLSGLPYLTPVYQFEPSRKRILICDSVFTSAAYAHIGLSLLFIDIPGRLISVFTIIATVVYVKRNTVANFNPTKRSLLRFCVALLCINILIVLTNVVSTSVLLLAMDKNVTVLISLTVTADVVLFLPAVVVPVLMMVLFKPIWSAVKGILVCRRCRARREVSPGRTTLAMKPSPE